MSSIQAFIQVLDEFLNELMETFPKVTKIKTYYHTFETLKKTNARKILDTFMEAIRGKEESISNKDEKIILKNPFLAEVEIEKWWTSNLSQNTKDAIWKYLNTLVFLGTSITAIPPDMMKGIEDVAEKCIQNLGEDGMPDMNMLMKNVQQMMGNMKK